MLTGLAGETLTDDKGDELHAAKTAATLIMKNPDAGSDAMIKYDWAMQLYKTGSVDLDKEGQQKFKKLLENIPNVWLVVRGQLLEVIDKRADELTKK